MVRPAPLIYSFALFILPPGFEGTRMKWPPELRTKPRDEVLWYTSYHLGHPNSEDSW
jgi:hypothetical protein